MADQSILSGEPDVGAVARLRASHCDACGRWEFPRRAYCPQCGSADVREAALGSSARVTATTAVLHPPPGSLVEAPYTVALAAFPEGLSVLGVVQWVAYEDVRVGAEVTPTVVELEGRLGYQFRLVSQE